MIELLLLAKILTTKPVVVKPTVRTNILIDMLCHQIGVDKLPGVLWRCEDGVYTCFYVPASPPSGAAISCFEKTPDLDPLKD
jgi:hypothetical protein